MSDVQPTATSPEAPPGSRRRLPHGFRAVAWIGIVLGIGGAWLALPPITARSWVWSLVVCLIAVMLGIGVAIRGERRFGGFAIASGVIGFTVAYLATLSGVGKLETVVVWSALFAAMLRYATPLIFAAIGGMFSERSGRGQHRSRGNDADGRLLRHPRSTTRPTRGSSGSLAGVLVRRGGGPRSTHSSRSTSAPTRSSAARRSTSSRSG